MRKRLTARGWSLVGALALATAIACRWPSARVTARRRTSASTPRPTTPTSTRGPRTTRTGAITIASNWIPGQVPANGPNFFRFDDRARYYNKIDNNGDGVEDIAYRFTFDTEVRNPNSFLYAGPGTQNYDGLNVIQTYDVVREDYKKGEVVKTTKVANNLPVAPPNIGPKTFPNYGNFVAGATRTLKDGTKLFVGTRDDPFFVDLGAAFDAINVRVLTGNQGAGRDDLSGYWTSSTVMQIPEELVTRDRNPVAVGRCGQRGGRRLVDDRAAQARGHQRQLRRRLERRRSTARRTSGSRSRDSATR